MDWLQNHLLQDRKENISKELKDLLDFLQQIEKKEYDENTADEKLLNLILLNRKDAVLLQCLFTSDGVSLLKMSSRLHFPLCQEYLLKNALYDPHELADQCDVLSEACKKGYTQVVKLLLLNKVEMSKQPICTPDSPFYLASYYGYVDILQLMVDSNPYLIRKSVRKTLLLVACMGGHLDAVKFWFGFQVLPSNDPCIGEKPVQEEHQFNPLYVAFNAKHMDVIKYLIDEGFPLTEQICRKFSDVVQRFLLMDYDTSDPQLEINWLHFHLPLLLNNWMQQIKTNITVLNISYNKLSDLPQCLPWEMPNLITLNVSNNCLSKFSGPTSDILCESLQILILSHNKLKMLCSEVFQIPSLKEIYVTNNQLVFLTEDEEPFHAMGRFFNTDVPRNCSNLSILNLSYNTLQKFPNVLPHCQNLTKFYASCNQLGHILDPWPCPLDTLDLSHNFLTEISSSLENFWTSTLQYVDLSYNSLTEISESIVRLHSLSELKISNNKIKILPDCNVWGCVNLKVLDVGYNCLGQDTEGKRRLNIFRLKPADKIETFDLEIPDSVLQSLRDFNLESNKLTMVPPSIAKMKSLTFLNLSGNSGIKKLPEELGLLESCKEFYTEGLDIVNVPKGIREADKSGKEILTFLQYKQRNSKPHWCMKLSVMGPEGKGKTSLLNGLTKGNVKNLKTSPGLSACTWTTERKWTIFPETNSIPSITFNVWEFSKPDKFSDIHNCFISKNSLFLLVWDIRKSVEELEPFLMSIEAKAKQAVVMFVGTFIDQFAGNKEELIKCTLSQIKSLYNKQHMSFIIADLWVTSTPENIGVKELATDIFNVAKNMKHNNHNGELFLSRKIPQSHISLAEKILQGISMNYCFEDEFKKFVEAMENNDIVSHADLQQASIFLHETGVLLYHPEFDNTSLYFFNPVWLFDLLAKIFMDERFKTYFGQQGKLNLRRAKAILDSILPQESKLDYTDLLETFGIALRLDKDFLFVPALLLDHPPGIDMGCSENKLVRLIKMCYIPPGFWNQLMIQVMLIMELLKQNMLMTYRFSHSNIFRRHKLIRSWSKYGSSQKYCHTQMVYWKKGLIATYNNGNFQICIQKDGILFTVQTFNKDFSMMGILMDELENITENVFPGLINDFSTYAVCPNCYFGISDSQIAQKVDHFCIEQCASVLMDSYSIKCISGHQILLEDLVPELMLMHIPSQFLLDKNEIECLDFIACGVSGSVFVGQYGKQNVALKFYQQMTTLHTSKESRGSSLQKSWKQKSIKKLVDARDFKNNVKEFIEGKLLLQKLRELQHEVLLLSHLKHPCIISLVGFILRPLCLVLELAPMRSLRLVINSHMNKHNKQEVLFPKMLTYRILLQIAEGMNYLHQKGIIYRDLKTDNILVWSLNLDCKVNIKLSDYNFSRYTTSKGMITAAGTPGYQAPEILAKQIYNEKVDIYAWSMVVYEVQSGLIPFHNLQSTFKISEAVLAKKRPSLKMLEIESRFPCLDELMIQSYDHSPSNRPTALQIVSTMRKMSFLFLKNIILEPLTNNNLDAQFLFDNDKGRQMIWLWEGQNDKRKFYIIDNTSQTVMHSSLFPGSQIICQINFNKRIWLATQNGEIEILGIQNQRFWLEVIETLKLPCTALVMLSQEEKCRVYVGLSNGVLMIFQKNLQQSQELESVSSWDKTCLELSESSQPLLTLVIIQNELWVTSGQNIYIVCLENFNILQTLKCPFPCTIISSGLVSTKQIFYRIQDSSNVLQFDVVSRQLLFVYEFGDIKMVGKVAEAKTPNNIDEVEVDDCKGDQNDCFVLSILLVDDALWVGRDIGDILIVSTDDRSGYKRGSVITALYPNYLLPETERLLGASSLKICTDKSVFSLLQSENENLVKSTRICFWEQYNIGELQQIHTHISQLLVGEEKM